MCSGGGDMASLADFEAATAIAYDSGVPVSPQLSEQKRQAQAFCQSFLTEAGSWDACLGVLAVTSSSSARFFCLQVGSTWTLPSPLALVAARQSLATAQRARKHV